MTATAAAFVAAAETEAREARWQTTTRLPGLIRLGGEDFVEGGPGRRRRRVYVNGFPVVGLQVLRPGDLVRIPRRRGEICYRYAGRVADGFEPAGGRTCAFTGRPIEGQAYRCPRCERVLSRAAAEQMGACICGRPLGPGAAAETPPEELL